MTTLRSIRSPSVRALGLVATGLILGSVFAAGARAQDPHSGHAEHDSAASAYAELEDRAVKALSEEEARGLERGEGMGFALSAELNGVPGPKHALELAEELSLTDPQRRAIGEIEERMAEEARAIGAEVLSLETELDRRFAHGHVTPDDVERLSVEIGEARGRLRAVHLNAHLETAEILDEGQVERYNRLRGYTP
ncbi:MAG: hypothetical protein U5R14_14335 [Gemmatimonadota bacterium]|nr:hypothetical protein [Gemmatimonadota bacterium]